MIVRVLVFRSIIVPLCLFCLGLALGLCLFDRAFYVPPAPIGDSQTRYIRPGEEPDLIQNDDLGQGDEARVYDVHDLLDQPQKWLTHEAPTGDKVRDELSQME